MITDFGDKAVNGPILWIAEGKIAKYELNEMDENSYLISKIYRRYLDLLKWKVVL